MAKQQTLVIHIDDFQWADVDSVQLIHALLRPPRPPSLLLVLSIRNDLGDCDVLRALDESEVIGQGAATRVELGPLSQSEAQELAISLARTRKASPQAPLRDRWSETIALRAGGNPFFVAQLVFSEDSQVSGDSDLAPVVRKRLDRLDPRARAVLEVIAVSGGPISKRLALSLCPGSSNEDIDGLRDQALIVGDHNDASEDSLLETAHDRVRAVAREAIDEAGARRSRPRSASTCSTRAGANRAASWSFRSRIVQRGHPLARGSGTTRGASRSRGSTSKPVSERWVRPRMRWRARTSIAATS